MAEVVQFRPERRIVAVQIGGLLLLAVGAIWMVAARRNESAAALLLASVGVLLVVVLTYVMGALRMRAELESDRIRVVGLIRTVAVQRERVVRVDTSSDVPLLVWIDDRGRERVHMLTALFSRRLLDGISPGSRERRDSFIERVNDWAGHPTGAAAG